MPNLEVERLPIHFENDERRVISRPFNPDGEARIRLVMDRVNQLSEQEVEKILKTVYERFADRHRHIESIFEENFEPLSKQVEPPADFSRSRRLLVGSYFTMEYSIASAALFNPSIVPHPDQSGLCEGAVRFVMSLRATGEGHISSIVFRTGVLEPDFSIHFDPVGKFSRRMRQTPDRQYEKQIFRRKLYEMAINQVAVDRTLEALEESFTLGELEHALMMTQRANPTLFQDEETPQSILWLARSNYQLLLPPGEDIADIVIFPQSDNESQGVEDLRLVQFTEEDGQVTYFGTYSAYNGYRVLPQLIETSDFLRISIHTLNGARAQNKGMALFPRRIGGHYVMCSRIDGENLFIMYSDIVQFWETAELLRTPTHPWELLQIGNCGSPLETPEGWLLLTHGVGPVRTYCIGAMLLDLDDPLKVIGHLDEPIIMPTEEERHGYVPNVVYSCGALIHGDRVLIPYAISDTVTSFMTVSLTKLLERLLA